MATPSLLVVDDAPEVRHLVRAYAGAEAAVAVAADAGTAMTAFAARRADIVLIDLVLGDQCGFALLAALRTLPGGPGARMIAMSAAAAAADRARTHRAGFDGHLAKPLSRERLWRAIAETAPDDVATHEAPLPAVARHPAIDDLVPDLLDGMAATTRQLDGLLAEGAHDAIRRIGHRIAGSGALYGYPALGQLGRALEDAARDGDRPAIALLAATLTRDVARACAELAPLRSRHG